MCTNYKAPHCATSSILLLLHLCLVQYSLHKPVLTLLKVRASFTAIKTDRIMVLYILSYTYLDSRQKDKKALDRMVATIPRMKLLDKLIPSNHINPLLLLDLHCVLYSKCTKKPYPTVRVFNFRNSWHLLLVYHSCLMVRQSLSRESNLLYVDLV
jgi:hypothetical protein